MSDAKQAPVARDKAVEEKQTARKSHAGVPVRAPKDNEGVPRDLARKERGKNGR